MPDDGEMPDVQWIERSAVDCYVHAQIPTQRKKREIVLWEIAKQFERGREYDEKEVNEIIHRFHEDHCTIRREMIACGIMARQKETYWLV